MQVPEIKTAHYQRCDLALSRHGHGSLGDFVVDRRQKDPPVSWAAITFELYRLTNGEAFVSEPTLRSWFLRPDTSAA